jgi:hypothetical protein
VWQPLPEGWFEAFDANTKQPYYYNPSTRQKTWARPQPRGCGDAACADAACAGAAACGGGSAGAQAAPAGSPPAGAPQRVAAGGARRA